MMNMNLTINMSYDVTTETTSFTVQATDKAHAYELAERELAEMGYCVADEIITVELAPTAEYPFLYPCDNGYKFMGLKCTPEYAAREAASRYANSWCGKTLFDKPYTLRTWSGEAEYIAHYSDMTFGEALAMVERECKRESEWYRDRLHK